LPALVPWCFLFRQVLANETTTSYIICILASATLYVVLASANKKRAAVPEDETERAKLAFQDLTDQENPYFRYVL